MDDASGFLAEDHKGFLVFLRCSRIDFVYERVFNFSTTHLVFGPVAIHLSRLHREAIPSILEVDIKIQAFSSTGVMFGTSLRNSFLLREVSDSSVELPGLFFISSFTKMSADCFQLRADALPEVSCSAAVAAAALAKNF